MFASLIAWIGALPAQKPYPRDSGAGWGRLHYEHSGEFGAVSVVDSKRGMTLSWEIGHAAVTTIPLPFDVGGGICHLGERRFLVAGITLTPAAPRQLVGTRVLDVRLNADRTITVNNTRDYAGVDLTEMVYNPRSRIVYSFDWAQTALIAFPWLGTLPLQDTLVVAATRVEAPILFDSRLRPAATGMGVTLTRRSGLDGPRWPDSVTITYAGTGWVALETYAESTPGWAFHHWRTNANGPTVEVIGTEGASGVIAIEDVCGRVVATGAVVGDVPCVVPIPRGTLIPGARYRVTGGTFQSSSWQVANSMWGAPRDSSTMQVVRNSVDDLYVGNPDFTVSMRCLWEGAKDAAPVDGTAYLVMGTNGAANDNVVADARGHARIAKPSAMSGPWPIKVGPESHGVAMVSTPIADDPALAGAELLFQWFVSDGSTWLASDVHGSLVFPSPMDPWGRGGLGIGATSRRANRVEATARAEEWLRAQPKLELTPERREIWEQVRSSFPQ